MGFIGLGVGYTCAGGSGGRKARRSTKQAVAAGDAPGMDPAENPYETAKYVDEYLMMHYGTKEDLLDAHVYLGITAPEDSFNFPLRCADECIHHVEERPPPHPCGRALDVGCAVGGSTFPLARHFTEVIGLEYSQSFVDVGNGLVQSGRRSYRMQTQGDLTVQCEAVIDPEIDRSRVSFVWGNACDLDPELGKFDVILAANLLCRTPEPMLFLTSVSSFLVPGGYLVMPSPYTWLEQYTPKDKWMGGKIDEDGNEITSFEAISEVLSEEFELVKETGMPFFIRETARKNQWTVSHLTVWRKKTSGKSSADE